jgi:hypothetical protein
MEHLASVGIAIECRTFVNDDGSWRIVLVLVGDGGKKNADIVSKWMHELLRSYDDYVDEAPPGTLQ